VITYEAVSSVSLGIGESEMLIHSFSFDKAITYAREIDFENRELIRKAALDGMPLPIPTVKYWGFRIDVRKCSKPMREFDIENVPKLIVDAFCRKQFTKWDRMSQYKHAGLYENDTIDTVRLLEVKGERIDGPDITFVEIHGWTEAEKIEF
jgi:hypothetical protein